jgi:thiamine transporter ThiT
MAAITNLSSITSNQLFQLAILVIAAVLVFVIVRYFFHIIVHIFHFVTSFLWHGCVIVVVLAIVLGILHYLKVF